MGLKFLDLFSGIGGFRLGMERAGHTCIGHVEIDKYANISYQAIHQPTEEELFHDDITTLPTEFVQRARARGVDVICGGFPCQAFSIAGKRLGFEDTRGTLFFHIAELAREIQPPYLFLENVRGLLSHDSGNTFETILRTLDDIGYDAEWQVLNSKDFGVPQNRERVFIVGHLRRASTRKVFPITSECQSVDGLQGQHVGTITTRTGESGTVGTYIVEGEQFSQDRQGVMVKEATKQGYAIAEPGDSINLEQPVIIGGMQKNQSVKTDGVCTTLTSSMGTGGGYVPMVVASRGRNLDNPSDQDNGFRIRKLTPKECWRLQGFPDWAFDRANEAKVSDSQLYKQAGNSVTVNVIEAIARNLKIEDRDHGQD